MTPTEALALVARLRDKHCCDATSCNCDEAADAIDALARALAEGPKVLALEWMHPCDDCWRAQGIERVYEIIALADGRFFLTNGPRLSEFPTIEAAKSAAEADHRARVLAQLEGQA